MSSRWCVAGDSEPGIVWWGDECVVHHLTSNETHRLAEPAGRLLERLRQEHCIDVSGDDVALMEALADLGFAVPC